MTPFAALGLKPALLPTLTELGYESPTPIQKASIPVLLENKDLLAQAQTGTGKTAAFALPLLSAVDPKLKQTQGLVIAPTRELAIQVAEAFQSYAKTLKGFHVAAIYGGQDYKTQLRALKRGPQVIVGTPGRLMDHMRRETLKVSHLKTLVLDEADEMLKMGFISDIEWILEQIPHDHQTALFSATMPPAIRKITKRYLTDPEHIEIKPCTKSVESIEQSFIRVHKHQKLEVLTRLLEIESINAAIIFARTKTESAELAEKLQARGHAAAALNGDMSQTLRKKTIDRIKSGAIDIIVATDVAARGIDVERVSHVVNYDIPYDSESYVHRIGRTGRAGRSGRAILFVSPREQRLLNDLQRATHASITEIQAPTIDALNEHRSSALAEKIIGVLQKSKRLKPYYAMIDGILDDIDCDPVDIAAALAYLNNQSNPLPTEEIDTPRAERKAPKHDRKPRQRSSKKPKTTQNKLPKKPRKSHNKKPTKKRGHK